MAIDTEAKRRSTLDVLPIPDGTINQADRLQVLGLYCGILAEAASGLGFVLIAMHEIMVE